MSRDQLLAALRAERLNTDWWTTSPKHDAEAGRRRAQIAADEATNYPTRNRKKTSA